MLADESGMSIEEFVGRQSKQIGEFLFCIQDEFIVACTNLTFDQFDELDLDQVNEIFEKVLEKNPVEGFFELEKKSPAGLVVQRMQAAIKAESDSLTPEEDPELSDIYTPDGGSDSNLKSSES